jgi:hypothetical protein
MKMNPLHYSVHVKWTAVTRDAVTCGKFANLRVSQEYFVNRTIMSKGNTITIW